jgi:hypothetical protein
MSMTFKVEVVLPMSCGCTEALVDDGARLVYCSADVCGGKWFCECADPEDPQLCDHATVLLFEIDAGMV